MRFLDFNYASEDSTTITASSSDANFPATNFKTDSPSRVWRSSGNFIIDATNNKIDFRETSGGGEITATLTSGSYSATTLAAEIKDAMEAVTLNARTYTVSQSAATGRWTITGATFLSLLWSSGTNTGTSVGPSLGFAVADQTGALTYTGAAIAIHTEESIIFDINTAENIDSIVVLPSPLNGWNLSTAATIKIQANATADFSSPVVDITLTFDEAFQAATHFFTTNQEYRYWRLQIVDPKNPDLYVEMGQVVIAGATTLTQAPERGFEFSIRDQSRQITNDFGNQFVDEFPFRKTVSFDYKVLQYTDVKTLERMFRRNGVKTPVTVVIDEAEDCFDKDHFLVYGKFQRTLTHSQENFTLFNESLTVTEVL